MIEKKIKDNPGIGMKNHALFWSQEKFEIIQFDLV